MVSSLLVVVLGSAAAMSWLSGARAATAEATTVFIECKTAAERRVGPAWLSASKAMS